jgi:hypothetical protein
MGSYTIAAVHTSGLHAGTCNDARPLRISQVHLDKD